MNKISRHIIGLSAVALAVGLGSCSFDEELSKTGRQDGQFRLNITTSEVGTRAATDITGQTGSNTKTDNEKKVQNIVCGVFATDGALVENFKAEDINQDAATYTKDFAHEYQAGSTTPAKRGISLAAGQTAVVALNLPATMLDTYIGFDTQNAFLSKQLDITEVLTAKTANTVTSDWLPMFGTGTVTSTSTTEFSATVPVKHLVAKVTLLSLKVDFSGTSHTAAQFTPEKVFLTNVPGKLDMQYTNGTYDFAAEDLTTLYQGEGDIWGSYDTPALRTYADYLGTSTLTAENLTAATAEDVATTGTFSKSITLYTMPNSETGSSNESNIRLVIKGKYKPDATLSGDGEDTYYAVNLGSTTDYSVAPNTHHVIRATIKGQGAPDAYSDIPSSQDFACNINILPWDENATTATFGNEGLNITAGNRLVVTIDQDAFTYNSSVQKPTVTSVKDANGNTISVDDCTVTYSDENSTNAGAYTVTVTKAADGGKNKLIGEVSYTISKAAGTISFATATGTGSTIDGTFVVPEVTNDGDGAISYAMTSNDDGAASSFDADTRTVTLEGTNTGTVVITATVADGTNYTYATPTATYTLTVVNNPWLGVNVGSIIYSDGTWTAKGEALTAGKTPVAIVFSTSTTAYDKDASQNGKGNFTHGYAMALKTDGNLYKWSSAALTETINTANPNGNLTTENYQSVLDDMEGLKYSNGIASKIANTGNSYTIESFPAYKAAINFSPSAPSNTSGWYLPSAGQMAQWVIAFAAGEVTGYAVSTIARVDLNSTTATKVRDAMNSYLSDQCHLTSDTHFTPFIYKNGSPSGWYWGSNERVQDYPYFLCFNTSNSFQITNAEQKAETFSSFVRPVLAF